MPAARSMFLNTFVFGGHPLISHFVTASPSGEALICLLLEEKGDRLGGG